MEQLWRTWVWRRSRCARDALSDWTASPILYGYLMGPGVDNNVRHEFQGNGKVGVSLDLGVQDGGEHEMGSAPSRLARTQCGPTLGKVYDQRADLDSISRLLISH